jgi:DNA-directed RNA polymerase specialized sigma subunit
MNDDKLIFNIKNNIKPNESLSELHDRHSGIFYKMINSYVPKDCGYADRQEFIDDSEYYIYCAALDFDESKKTKFSTYLGNKTRWMCLNKYNKSKKSGELVHEDFLSKKYLCPNDDFLQAMIKEELIEKIFNSIEQDGDQRIQEIFRMRYIIGHKNKVMPWRKISEKMNLSIQGCINIHDTFIKKIQRKKIN